MISLLRSILSRLWPRIPAHAHGERPAAAPPSRTEEEGPAVEETHAVLIDGADTLDLHAFHPRDVPSVVREFLDVATGRGLVHVRIIHGKGIGVQRGIVRGILEKDPRVVSFGDSPDAGWGATVARLRKRHARLDGEGR